MWPQSRWSFDFPIFRQSSKAASVWSTSRLLRPFNNIERALEDRLRPSNSASPRLHSTNLDSLVIRNPPGNTSMSSWRTFGRRAAKHLGKTWLQLGSAVFTTCWRRKSGFRWRRWWLWYFSVRKFDVFSVEEHYLLLLWLVKVADRGVDGTLQTSYDNYLRFSFPFFSPTLKSLWFSCECCF